MAGRMANLDSWLAECADLSINIVIVHDIQDPRTSTDLGKLVKKYDHLAIQLIEGTFGSPGLARNAGLKSSRSAIWTAFWDADDVPNPREVLTVTAEVDAKYEVIIGNFTVDSPGGVTAFKHHEQIENVALNPGLWRMVFHSSVLDGVEFCDSRMGEDQLMLIDLNLGSRRIHFSGKNFYQYFQGNPMQLTSSQDSINEVQKTLTLVYKRMLKNHRLRNKFSEIVLLRLLITTIFRTKGMKKVSLVIKHSLIILQIRPQTFFRFISSVCKIRKTL